MDDPAGRGDTRVQQPCDQVIGVLADPSRFAETSAFVSARRALWRIAAPLALSGCVLFAGWLVLPGLGERPLYSAGEVRNALVAQAMVESGDWVQPRLATLRYYEKPPLMYWLMAASYEVLGMSETASRLPAALAYLATVALVFRLALELLGRCGALAAALIFATAAAPYHFGRFVSLDTVGIAALMLSMLGLTLSTRGDRLGPLPTPSSEYGGAVLFWLGAALAGLTKGLLGMVFPVAVALLYAGLIGGRPVRRRLHAGIGVALLAAVWLPWHVVLAWRDPAFLPYYLLNEHIYRFLNIREPIDYSSLGAAHFWLAALLWFFPWALFLPAAIPAAWRRRRRLGIPLIWAMWVLLFFTVSRARLEYYAQPAYPCLAILVAAYWQRCARRRRLLGLAIPSAVMACLGVIVTVWLWLQVRPADLTAFVSTADGYYREYFLKQPERAFFFSREAAQLGKPFALWLALLGGTALLALWTRRVALALVCWLVCLTPALSVFDRGIALLADDRSQRLAADIVRAHWEPGAMLVVVGTYEDAAGIALYSAKPARVFEGADGDLLFGYRHGDGADLFLTREQFDRMWHSSTRVFALAQIERAPADGIVLLETPRHRLLSNQPTRGATQPRRNDEIHGGSSFMR